MPSSSVMSTRITKSLHSALKCCKFNSAPPFSLFRAPCYWRNILKAQPTPLRTALWRRQLHPHLLHLHLHFHQAFQQQHHLHLLHCRQRCQRLRITLLVAPPPTSDGLLPHLEVRFPLFLSSSFLLFI